MQEGKQAHGLVPNRCDPPTVHADEDGLLYSPEDVWNVRDPLYAAEVFLKVQPGWSDVKTTEHPASTHVVRKRWKELGAAVGPKDRDEIWRRILFKAYEERGYGWRSHVAVFIKNIETAKECHLSLESDGIKSGKCHGEGESNVR